MISRKVSLRFLSQPQSMKKPALNVDLSPAAEEKSKERWLLPKEKSGLKLAPKVKS